QALVWENGSTRSAEAAKTFVTRYAEADVEALVKKQQPATSAMAVLGGEEVRRGYLALKNDDLAGAQKLFEEALAKNPKQSGALTGIGFIRMKQQDFTAALK